MKVWQTSKQNSDANGGYVSIHDDGWLAERRLFIEDDEGRTV